MKYDFIKMHSGEFSVSRICQTLDVSKSGYYSWLKCPRRKRLFENEIILERIKSSHSASDKRYGSPGILQDLIEEGITCSLNRVEKLMHVLNHSFIHLKQRKYILIIKKQGQNQRKVLSSPSAQVLIRIAKLFNVFTDYLHFDDRNDTSENFRQ